MPNDTIRAQSIQVLRERSVLRAPEGQFFTLKSGAKSKHYIDVRRTSLSALGLSVLTTDLIRMLMDLGRKPTYVAGVALGGCPFATSVSLRTSIDALYIRPEPKGHGTGKLVEGVYDKGASVVLLEDVVTTGGSTLRALQALSSEGLVPVGVLAVIDREEGGRAAIEAVCPFVAMTTLRELLAE